ncbi:MAG: hypothetical protein M1608_10990 [Candidatus Omnitrophica bacterium]|nr:hypothetical protein [Candidatus Omnitrophota bacterium]
MRAIKKFFPLWLLALLLAGCTTTITNLTPNQAVRNSSGLYPVGAAWESAKQSIQDNTLKAYVLIDMKTYPMQRTPMVNNRWETLIPVPADENTINYRFKFDYQYLGIPHREENSVLSPIYHLQIIDN